MPYPSDETELARLLRTLGAHNPEEWVKYVVAEPEGQLARYLFLKQAWDRIIQDGEVKWIDDAIERSNEYPDEPYAGLGTSLRRALEAGACREDLSEIGRCLQAQMLFNIGYLLDGPAHSHPGLEALQWALFRVAEDGKAIGKPIAGLHESVLETDPTGREMRPTRSDA